MADVAIFGRLMQLGVQVGITNVDLAVIHEQSEARCEVVTHDSSVVQRGKTLQLGWGRTTVQSFYNAQSYYTNYHHTSHSLSTPYIS